MALQQKQKHKKVVKLLKNTSKSKIYCLLHIFQTQQESLPGPFWPSGLMFDTPALLGWALWISDVLLCPAFLWRSQKHKPEASGCGSTNRYRLFSLWSVYLEHIWILRLTETRLGLQNLARIFVPLWKKSISGAKVLLSGISCVNLLY